MKLIYILPLVFLVLLALSLWWWFGTRREEEATAWAPAEGSGEGTGSQWTDQFAAPADPGGYAGGSPLSAPAVSSGGDQAAGAGGPAAGLGAAGLGAAGLGAAGLGAAAAAAGEWGHGQAEAATSAQSAYAGPLPTREELAREFDEGDEVVADAPAASIGGADNAPAQVEAVEGHDWSGGADGDAWEADVVAEDVVTNDALGESVSADVVPEHWAGDSVVAESANLDTVSVEDVSLVGAVVDPVAAPEPEAEAPVAEAAPVIDHPVTEPSVADHLAGDEPVADDLMTAGAASVQTETFEAAAFEPEVSEPEAFESQVSEPELDGAGDATAQSPEADVAAAEAPAQDTESGDVAAAAPAVATWPPVAEVDEQSRALAMGEGFGDDVSDVVDEQPAPVVTWPSTAEADATAWDGWKADATATESVTSVTTDGADGEPGTEPAIEPVESEVPSVDEGASDHAVADEWAEASADAQESSSPQEPTSPEPSAVVAEPESAQEATFGGSGAWAASAGAVVAAGAAAHAHHGEAAADEAVSAEQSTAELAEPEGWSASEVPGGDADGAESAPTVEAVAGDDGGEASTEASSEASAEHSAEHSAEPATSAADGGDWQYDEAHEGLQASADSAAMPSQAPETAAWGRRISDLDEVVDGGFGSGSAAPIADGAQPLGHAIQAYFDTRTYRTEDSPGYDSCEPDVWFFDEGSAQRAGFGPAQEG